MACINPGTTSPGKMFWVYTDAGGAVLHKLGFHLLAPIDITVLAPLRVEANRIAAYLLACVPATMAFTDWGISLPNGHTYYQEALTSFGPGTHAQGGSMQAYRSTTVAFVGRGQAGGPGGCAGRVIARLFNSGALQFRPAAKFIATASDGPYQALVQNGFNASAYLPADFYGQHATLDGDMPIQFNASAQRRLGT